MPTIKRIDHIAIAVVPRPHISRISFARNGRAVLVAHCSTAVAKNPYFELLRRRPGRRPLQREWVDTRGETDRLESVLD